MTRLDGIRTIFCALMERSASDHYMDMDAEAIMDWAADLEGRLRDKYGARTERKTFKPPGDGEWTEYFLQIGGTREQAAKSWDHYTLKGWRVGSTVMKDWRAAVRNWIRTDKERKAERREVTGAKEYMTWEQMVLHAKKNDLTHGPPHYEQSERRDGKGRPLWRAA